MLRRMIVLVSLFAVVIGLGPYLRTALGIEISPEALQNWVRGYGLWAPLAFTLLLTFRHALFVPSTLVLTVGGACLGLVMGCVVGSIGLLASGLLEFVLFRYFRPESLVRRAEARIGDATELVARATPLVVLATTAIPPTPMTAFYWAASLTQIRLSAFALYAGIGGIVRAFILSLLGVGLVASDRRVIAIAVGVTLVIFASALLSPTLRRLLLGVKAEATSTPASKPEPDER